MRPTVLVTVASQGWVHREVAMKLLELAADHRAVARIGILDDKPYESAMNRAADECLESVCEFWLHMDADNPPAGNPFDLLALDKDMIGLPTPIWVGGGKDRPCVWNVFDARGDKYCPNVQRDGLRSVDAVGSGCFVVRRRVLENVRPAFVTLYDERGVKSLGADLNFCRRVKAAGFDVFAHWDYPCRHFNEIDLSTVAPACSRLSESQKQPSETA